MTRLSLNKNRHESIISFASKIHPPEKPLVAFVEIVFMPGIVRVEIIRFPVFLIIFLGNSHGLPKGMVGEKSAEIRDRSIFFSVRCSKVCTWKPPCGLFLGEPIATQPLVYYKHIVPPGGFLQFRSLIHSNIIQFIELKNKNRYYVPNFSSVGAN